MLEMDLKEFTSVLASKEPVPGGGGASALVGAVGMALGNMVGSLTVGKKTYADVEEDVKRLMKEGEKIRQELLDLVEEDAAAFAPLAKAYGIPKDDPDRDEIMEKALYTAAAAPLKIMRKVGEALVLMEGYAYKGSKIAISDVGVGALCCKAALQGASLNVYVNTKLMKDRQRAHSMENEVQMLLWENEALADKLYEAVLEKLRG